MRSEWGYLQVRETRAIWKRFEGCWRGRACYPPNGCTTTRRRDCTAAARREGETVRRLIDCLIAAVAIGAGVPPVLHRDDDFDVLARHTELDIVR